MINHITLIGSVWDLPEALDPVSGFAIAFSLAVFGYRNACEEPPHRIEDWYQVVVKDELASCCNKRLQIGYLIYVKGRVQAASIAFEQNGRASTIETRCQVIADTVMILSKTV